MAIKGTVLNGQIQFDSVALPEGTQVLITPIQVPTQNTVAERDLDSLRAGIQRISALPSESTLSDDFSGADHDDALYG